MNIAIAVDGDDMMSAVSSQLELCTNLLIVNVETQEVAIYANPKQAESVSGELLAKEVVRHNCEAVITGVIRDTAFNIIADNGVTRFLGVGYDAQKALELMDGNGLDLIRSADGKSGCDGTHHH